MSIESQAMFYYRSVCDFDSSGKAGARFSESLLDGFDEFSMLLRRIYSDWKSYETSAVQSVKTKIGIMADDLENYHNLTYTIDSLYSIAVTGELCSEGSVNYLRVDKALFKSLFKQSVTFPFEMLEKYGFYFTYAKNGNEVAEYKRCDSFHLYYENGSSLIEAMKFLAEELSQQDKQKEMPKNVAFMIADYHFILTGELNNNPLHESIVNALGIASGFLKTFAATLQNEYALAADLFFNPYVFPNKTITFRRNKKTVCKFIIELDSLSIRLPLPYEIAKVLISQRNVLPQSISEDISRFGCTGCGKCGNQSNIEIFEGIRLCRLKNTNFFTENSRCLLFTITNEDEVKVIIDVIKDILQAL